MTQPNAILTIVIPALNEQDAIGQTIQRCLDAIPHIQGEGVVPEVEIIVVSDGSTDRTSEIAMEFSQRHESVRLVVFPVNRGYGAAIKCGFRLGRGNLVGFLDADGTCDPRFFAPLCFAVLNRDADMALGDRMGRDSRMPRIRRVGNRVFAALLGFLSGDAVRDTASGMRVLRREALADLYPLPDGLDFTPAMSARAVMQRLRITEVPMAYAERLGESKLRALKDGVRFLRAIFDAVLFYQPTRLFVLGFWLCMLVLAALALTPSEFYLRNRYLEEWMIYRFIACLLLGTVGFLLLCAAVAADALLGLAGTRLRWRSFTSQVLGHLFSKRALLMCSGFAVIAGSALVWPGFVELARTGHVTLHWSRVIVAAFAYVAAVQCIVFASLLKIISLWRNQLASEPRGSFEVHVPRCGVVDQDKPAVLAASNIDRATNSQIDDATNCPMPTQPPPDMPFEPRQVHP